MTYRELYSLLSKRENQYLNKTVIKTLLMDDGGFHDFYDLLKNFDKNVANYEVLMEKLEKIESGEPMQYVLGYAYFVNSNYKVDARVLIPRQETELLAVASLQLIIKTFGKDPEITIVDVGTGSGVLAIYLKEYFKKAKVIATDISSDVIAVAKENAKLHSVDIDFRVGNVLDEVKEKVDVVISNPPYIGDKKTVNPQTLKYEPHLALFAEPKTKFYEEILSHIDNMNDKCLFAFEIGEDMEEELTNLLEEKYIGLAYRFDKDIYGKVRYLYVIRDDKYEVEQRCIVF